MIRHSLPALCALLAVVLVGCGGPATKELHVYNWAEYIDPELITAFEAKHGVKVILDTFEDPEAMIAKLEAGGKNQYDIVVPSDYHIPLMVRKGLLAELDASRLPHLGNLAEAFANPPYDAGLRHCVPYHWGTSAIAWRADKVAEGLEIDSWSVFFDEQAKAGDFMMLADMREVIGAALKYQGHSLNSTDPAELAAAKELLLATKARSTGFAGSVESRTRLLAGDVALVHAYSGDIVQAIDEEEEGADQLRYAVPKEGGVIWVDNLAICSGAPQPELAYAFIDYLLEAEVAKQNAEYIGYPTANAAAEALLDPEVRGDPMIYPDAETRARLEFVLDLGEQAPLYEAIWTDLRAR
jgi:spermidine/putrescine transport system substrate-binding protein